MVDNRRVPPAGGYNCPRQPQCHLIPGRFVAAPVASTPDPFFFTGGGRASHPGLFTEHNADSMQREHSETAWVGSLDLT